MSRQVIGRCAADDTAADDDNVLLSILVLVGHFGEVASRLKSVGETCGRICVLLANSFSSQSLEGERSNLERLWSEVLKTSNTTDDVNRKRILTANQSDWSQVQFADG